MRGWPLKHEWPFPETMDEYCWATLAAREKSRLQIEFTPLHGWKTPWQKQKQAWIDQFLTGLNNLVQSPTTVGYRPSISVLMAVYNGADTVAWALNSVLYQSFPDFELIVVDDASTDFTKKEIRRFRDPRIHLISQRYNQGKARCLNEAWRAARGEWLFELDADDWLGPEALDWAVRSCRDLPKEVALLYGDRIYWKEEPSGRLVPRYKRTGEPIRSLDQYLDDLTPPGPRIYRREAIRQTGGWPVDWYQNGRLYEDIHLVLKLLENYSVRYVAGVHYHVRLCPDSVSQGNTEHFAPWKERILAQYRNRRN